VGIETALIIGALAASTASQVHSTEQQKQDTKRAARVQKAETDRLEKERVEGQQTERLSEQVSAKNAQSTTRLNKLQLLKGGRQGSIVTGLGGNAAAASKTQTKQIIGA